MKRIIVHDWRDDCEVEVQRYKGRNDHTVVKICKWSDAKLEACMTLELMDSDYEELLNLLER